MGGGGGGGGGGTAEFVEPIPNLRYIMLNFCLVPSDSLSRKR